MVPIIEATSKQTSLLWTLPRLSIRCNIEDYRISWSIMVFQKISSSGSRLGYLGEHKKLSGVSRCYKLGPILFLIFINDLPDNINSTVRLFEDDYVLYRIIRKSEDQQILQDDLSSVGRGMAHEIQRC